MAQKNEATFSNKYWNDGKRPFITIITPVYNRRATIQRTINSVEAQKIRNFEYIIIDDGSTEPIDDIVKEFIEKTKIPVSFVKKKNGGVHTARNLGYKLARGEMVLCIDSDDELLPNATKVFYEAWNEIPKKDRKDYWQIKAQCVDQNGRQTAEAFPEDINRMPIALARKYFSLAGGEQIGCRVTKIMKKNLFPEPEGVTFVREGVRWVPLENKYRSWGVNEAVRIYHLDSEGHLSGKGENDKKRKRTQQDIRNNLWNSCDILNNARMYNCGLRRQAKEVVKYCTFSHILKWKHDSDFVSRCILKGLRNKFMLMLFWLPSYFVARKYMKDKMTVATGALKSIA